jgi:hypothetical protein
MARIKTSVTPKTIWDKYTIKQLHDKIKNYNISNVTRMKKPELINYLDSRFTLNGEMIVLKYQNQFPAEFQTNNDSLDFSPDLFSDFNESQNPLLMQSMDLPVARKAPPPATKGNRKILPTTANRKIMPTGRPRGRPRKNPI